MTTNTSQRQRLEQGRAKHAYGAATAIATSTSIKDKDKKEYKSYTKKVPMLIKTNGLGATLAFMKAKGKAYQLILNSIENWLKEDIKFSAIVKEIKGDDLGDDLMGKIVNCDSNCYRALTIEILAYLNWLKRFADGLIKED